ncbi:MAG: PilZ domain-containing protein [Acidobacteria bacterium]|nr:PilZ domain-containing protein [Acidobacteriota bacterium]
MPELMREIANRLREFVGNRRRAPRYRARLAVAVSLLDSRARTHPSALEGHTHDLSDGGLAVVLPAIRIGDRYLTGASHTLRITLKLPSGAIQIHGSPMCYERLDAGEGVTETGYLVGVKIKEMSDKDRALFDEYLKTLKK